MFGWFEDEDYSDDTAVVIRDGSAVRNQRELDAVFVADVADLVKYAAEGGYAGVAEVWRADALVATAEKAKALIDSGDDDYDSALDAVETLTQCVYDAEILLTDVGMWYVDWNDGFVIWERG